MAIQSVNDSKEHRVESRSVDIHGGLYSCLEPLMKSVEITRLPAANPRIRRTAVLEIVDGTIFGSVVMSKSGGAMQMSVMVFHKPGALWGSAISHDRPLKPLSIQIISPPPI